jgi:hypothetical protein
MVLDGLVCSEEEMVWLDVWRCMNCGDLLDPAIETHRRAQGFYAGAVAVCAQG